MRELRTASVVGLFLFALSFSDRTLAETETFDSAASVAANGWVEFGSRDNQFDFGFSPTNNAEGASGGEGGGLMARSGPRGYFADVSAITRDLSLPLNATGRFNWQDMNFDGAWFFGWFDTTLAEADERAFVGISFIEQRADGWRILASINDDGTPPTDVNSPCNGCNDELRFVLDNTPVDFALAWDPTGGNSPGEGKMTLSLTTVDGSAAITSALDGSVSSSTISTAFGPADAIAGYNAFGILANSQGPRNDLGNFWFDDLEYTLDERKPPGDFNEDGVIDTADFLILAANFDTGRTFAEGDNNFDGRVNLLDFVEFRRLFQAAQQQGATAAVPEPSSLTMLGLALFAWAFRRRR